MVFSRDKDGVAEGVTGDEAGINGQRGDVEAGEVVLTAGGAGDPR